MGKKRIRKPCYMCGKPSSTDDHIPPKSLFATGDRKDLIKVDACKRCNVDRKKDDELFIWVVSTMCSGSSRVQDAHLTRIIGKVLKSRRGLIRYFYDMSKKVEMKSPAGLYLGYRYVVELDKNGHRRVQKVVDAITCISQEKC